MTNFDVADFSDRRSEEVISFFWHSVYLDVSTKIMGNNKTTITLWAR